MSRPDIVYSAQTSDYDPGLRYSNPRFFSQPKTNVKKVRIIGNWPEIVWAYEKLDVEVEVVSDNPAATAPSPFAQPEPKPEPGSETPAASEGGEPPVSIPEGWRDLAWPQLRSLASKFDNPITNRTEAETAVEAELARRAGEQKES